MARRLMAKTMAKTMILPGLEGVPLPFCIHQKIDTDKRTIIVGDIHGCFDELQALLEMSLWNQETDQLILVGDLMSKGPKPLEVLRFAQQPNVWCIRGNHDDAAIKAHMELSVLSKAERKESDLMRHYKYTIQFTKSDIKFLRQLPYTIQLRHFNSIVVHAGLVPGIPLEEQQPVDMYKMRNLIENSETLQPTSSDKEGVPWASKWKGPEHVYFGHDAKRGLQNWTFATGLDTGCCYGKKLTAIILPDRQLVSIPAAQIYCKPSG